MRQKKSRRRGSGNSPAKSPPVTPAKSPGRRGRPPSKSPSAALPQTAAVSTHENNHNSVSPEHSRTSSSDQDAYHSHPAPTQFNSNPVHPAEIGKLFFSFLLFFFSFISHS